MVAEEVRNSALRSAVAEKDTSALIEDSQQRANQGVQASSDVKGLLERVLSVVDQVNRLIGNVAASSRQQTVGVSQVNAAVAQMDQVVQSNAANAEQTAPASAQLSSQAESLSDIVGKLTALVHGRKRRAGALARPPDGNRTPAVEYQPGGNASGKPTALRDQIALGQVPQTSPPVTDQMAYDRGPFHTV